MCSVKKVFLKISQNSHENTCDRDSEIFVKFLRTPFYMEQLRWLLLYFYLHQLFQIKIPCFTARILAKACGKVIAMKLKNTIQTRHLRKKNQDHVKKGIIFIFCICNFI